MNRPYFVAATALALGWTSPVSALDAAKPEVIEKRPVSVGGLPGSFEIPGTGLSLALGGFLKLDANFSSAGAEGPGGANTFDQFIIPGAIPIGEVDGESNQLTFHARESRIWFKAYRASDWGDFYAYLELDFFAFTAAGDERISDSHAPRLRHGYGSFGPLLAGQTWTTFMNPSAIPENLDFVGTVGTSFARQPLVRWTQPLGAGWSVMLAAEQPETTVTATTGGRLTPGDDRIPDIVLAVQVKGDFGNLKLAFLGRQLRVDTNEVNAEAYGGGVSLAGRIKIYGRDNLRFNVNAGNALGRYVSLNALNGGFVNANGDIEGIASTTGHIAYQHYWIEQLRSTATFSFLQAFLSDDLLIATTTRQVLSGSINLLFSPIPRTTFGVEYIFARRELDDGSSGDFHRGQASWKFVF